MWHKFKLMLMSQAIINIPIQRIKDTEGEASKLRLLAASIIIKENFEFSTFHTDGLKKSMKTRKLMGILHCGCSTAERLLDDMKESPLFNYSEKNGVYFAMPLRSRNRQRNGNYRPSKSDHVYKLEYDKTNPHTLREMVKILRQILLENRVRSSQRATYKAKSTVGLPLKDRVIPLRSMAKEIGLSKSSVSRYIKELGKAGKVSKSEMVAECVVPVLNDETARQWSEKHPKGGQFFMFDNPATGCLQGWKTLGRAYYLKGRNADAENKKFKHVIYSHKKRISTKYVKKETGGFDEQRFKQLYDC